jgi:hypothetical protein
VVAVASSGTAVLDPVATVVDGEGDTPAHYTCCDEQVAMCGAPLADALTVDDDDPSPDCLLCVFVWDEHLPCPAAGCPADGAT